MTKNLRELTNAIMEVFESFIDERMRNIQSIAGYNIEKEEFLSDCLRGMVFKHLCSVDFDVLNSSDDSNQKFLDCTVAIAGMLEEVFAERNLYLPSEERNNEPGEACIYGADYYELEDAIKDVLHGYKAEYSKGEDYDISLEEAKKLNCYKFAIAYKDDSFETLKSDILNNTVVNDYAGAVTLELGFADLEMNLAINDTETTKLEAYYYMRLAGIVNEKKEWESHDGVTDDFSLDDISDIETIERRMFEILMSELKRQELYWSIPNWN